MILLLFTPKLYPSWSSTQGSLNARSAGRSSSPAQACQAAQAREAGLGE
jgi:hypothetical protein